MPPTTAPSSRCSSRDRTDAVVREVNEILTATPGVYSTAAFAGLDGATLTNASNDGAIFSVFKPRSDRCRCARGERDPYRDTRCLLDSRLCRTGWGDTDECLQRRRHLLGVQAEIGPMPLCAR